MTREEAFARFSGAYAEELHRLKISELEDSVERDYEKIQAGIVEGFRRLFVKIEAAGKVTGFITVSLLRSSLKLGGANCLLSAYDANWYLDQRPVEEYYDAGWLLGYLNEYEKALNLERKKYVGKVTGGDAERLKWDKFYDYKNYLVLMFRKAMESVVRLEEYKRVKTAASLDIRVGEYYDLTESVWFEDNRGAPEDRIKTLLEMKYENQDIYRHFKDVDLSNGDYAGVNFMYSRFERVNLSGSAMYGCVLVGAKFAACNMRRADLRGSGIWFGDFSNCGLREANLSYVNYGSEAAVEKLDKKMFIRTGFREADLREADLSNGNFSGCDFTGADMTGCNTEGAKLRKALLNEKYLYDKSLALTDEQRGEISWVK